MLTIINFFSLFSHKLPLNKSFVLSATRFTWLMTLLHACVAYFLPVLEIHREKWGALTICCLIGSVIYGRTMYLFFWCWCSSGSTKFRIEWRMILCSQDVWAKYNNLAHIIRGHWLVNIIENSGSRLRSLMNQLIVWWAMLLEVYLGANWFLESNMLVDHQTVFNHVQKTEIFDSGNSVVHIIHRIPSTTLWNTDYIKPTEVQVGHIRIISKAATYKQCGYS